MMNTATSVYMLAKILGNPDYQGFRSTSGHFLETVPQRRTTRHWTVKRVARGWTPPRVTGRVMTFNDFPCVDMITPAFSARAVAVLKELLDQNGELLPIMPVDCSGEYYAYNVTTVADVLDLNGSKMQYLSDGITALGDIAVHEFDVNKVGALSIFRIPEKPYTIYVTDNFLERVKSGGLKGFECWLVWPLPRDVKWMELKASKYTP